MNEIPRKAFTHAGKFHADEVFATAVLRFLNPKMTVRRGFRVPEHFDGIVYDIGFGQFDHHQQDAEKRPNGIPYAAFGLIWRTYGTQVLSAFMPVQAVEEEAARFDEKFIQHIDKDDNTGCGDILGDLIGTFNPCWDSEASADDCFAEAVDFAAVILRKRFESLSAAVRARKMAQAALEQMEDGVVTMPAYAPWKGVLVGAGAEFVIYPSQRGGYSAQCVPKADQAHTLPYPFPAAWAGLSEEELPQISGIATLRFCHNSRFLVTAGTIEDAREACRKAKEADGA